MSVGLPVIPMRIEDVTPSSALGYFINSVHLLDALTPPLESHLEQLAYSVERLLHRDDPPVAERGIIPGPRNQAWRTRPASGQVS